MVVKDVRCLGSESYDSFPAASTIAFGAAVVVSTAGQGVDTIRAVEDEVTILGLADKREYLLKGGYDGFYAQYEQVPIVTKRGYGLVIANCADVNIDLGDWLEVAILGDNAPGNHGILEEAGSTAGETYTTSTVAKALESVTMGSASYKQPSVGVSIGDSTITLVAADLTLLDLDVGDYIYLEDANGNGQINKVASLTSTVITLVMPSTVALQANTDYVSKVFPCKMQLL